MRLLRTWVIPVLMLLGLIFSSVGAAAAIRAQDDKPTVAIGSKNYTESIIQSEIVAQLLEDAGYTVERKFDLGGTGVAHQALISNEIDTYVEWTGTGTGAILQVPIPEGDTPEEIAQNTYDLVSEQYMEQFGIRWLEDWGYNNTYALAVTPETAEEYDLETISDLKAIAGDMSLGTDQEFPVREDGLPGLEETYGIEFGDVVPGDQGLMYGAVDSGDVDVIASYSTDGRIPALDLVLLEDDLGYFPPYNPAPIFHDEFLDENPEIAEILNQLGGEITEAEAAEMNYMVDEEGMSPAAVATQKLTEMGLLGDSATPED